MVADWLSGVEVMQREKVECHICQMEEGKESTVEKYPWGKRRERWRKEENESKQIKRKGQ